MTQTKCACALICEYNPLHFGHRYQLNRLKEQFETVICILGGNLSQRGEVAVSDRYVRAEAALAAGADLVIELPLPWCCASAREFACGGVFLAKAIGADALAFSAESDSETLKTAASLRKNAEEAIRAKMKQTGNLSYPAAAQQILGRELAGRPNDILGIEYLAHAGDFPVYILAREQTFLSSTVIRASEHPLELLPPEVRAVFASDRSFPRRTDTVGHFLLASLRNGPGRDVYGVSDELYAHMASLALSCDSFGQFLKCGANKMYTTARLRRAAWSMVFGFPKELPERTPPYALLLAVSGNGRRFLAETDKTRDIPVVSRPAVLRENGIFRLNARVNEVLRLFFGGTSDCEKHPFVAE